MEERIYCTVCGVQNALIRGSRRLCARHYRFSQMRSTAKSHGKRVPYVEELLAMPGINLKCPDCGVAMNWLSSEGQCTVASLQHYRDGTMAIVCRSCNTRHASMEKDTYRNIPKDCKVCPACSTLKPDIDFFADASRTGQLKRTSKCKACCKVSLYKWRAESNGKFAEYQRNYRLKKKSEAIAKATTA